jgi:N-acetylglucosamine-6-phosphate deacetylase
LLLLAKGVDNVALVTDGVTPAGLTEGAFRIGEQEARLSQGRITLPDGTIAGSVATMDAVVRNVVGWGLAPLAEVVGMASSVPARVLGLDDRKGRIAPRHIADLVALDEEMQVVMTWVGGERVYSRSERG